MVVWRRGATDTRERGEKSAKHHGLEKLRSCSRLADAWPGHPLFPSLPSAVFHSELQACKPNWNCLSLPGLGLSFSNLLVAALNSFSEFP